MSVTSQIIKKLNDDITQIQKGLQPDQLSFWYQKIISDTKEMAPPWVTRQNQSKTGCNPANEI